MSATANTTPATNTQGGQAGAGAADVVKGAVKVVHGGLEKLRGEALTAADAGGDRVSGSAAKSAQNETSAQSNTGVATKGEAEFNKGMAAFGK